MIDTLPTPKAASAQGSIPPMTHPLGRYWDQPPRDRVLVDDQHALLSPQDFQELGEYSTSLPSGVYPGKMWKRREPGVWYLGWFGETANPELCSVNFREIILV